jgi:pimeloyl-ACP methyl ester carboxylesterase
VWVDPALGSSAMRPMGEAVEVLAQDFEVVTYDRRGRGRNAAADTSAAAEIADLVALVDDLGDVTSVIGFSSGGALALQAAPRLAVSSVILLEPAVDESPDRSGLRETVTAAIDAGDYEAAVRAFHDAIGVPDEVVGQLVSSGSWPDVVRIAPSLPADIDLALVDDRAIARVRVPVHLIVSDGSPDEIRGMSERLAERLGAPMWTEPGGWHGVDPDALRVRVRAILDGQQ